MAAILSWLLALKNREGTPVAEQTMHWASALYSGTQADAESSAERAVFEVCRTLASQMNGRPVDLLFVFASPAIARATGGWLQSLIQQTGAQVAIGCSGGGIIAAGREIEEGPSLAVLAAHLPGVAIRPFLLDPAVLPDPDSPPKAWEDLVGVSAAEMPQFVLLGDGGGFPVEALLAGLDFAFPGAVKVGGLASGSNRPGGQRLFLNERVSVGGLVGVALSGDIVIDPAVAQGCRPVGEVHRITLAEGNMIWELDGKPALQVLQQVVRDMSDEERELARHSLFVGVLMDEFQGHAGQGDFLIRNLMGVEPRQGGLAVGDWLRSGQTIRFHLRDATTSRADLELVLARYRLERQGSRPAGALLFACLGRGSYLYGEPDVDSRLFGQLLGEGIPIAGFFCNGEIGPVGGTTFLHGYTSSFGLFRPRRAPSL